ncbi:MAG TPA: DUF2127 domain-containing protein [Acidimicrobiales bacterium]|nr:DUF2127 domain-containing protein [Acidimicrobiales bacterium]
MSQVGSGPPAARPPGTEKPRRFRPQLRYELVSCGLNGHELLGTDAARLRLQDAIFARQDEGFRWYRCLRCDAWLPLPNPERPAVAVPPERDEVQLPLRGRPLRDRYVLRLISAERAVHVVVLGALAAAIFAFAAHRGRLHDLYTRVLSDLQGGLGGPVFGPHSGVISDLNRLFALTQTELDVAGVALSAYVAVLACEMVGLWWARRWAEYLTFVETSVLVPFEIYEVAGGVSALKLLTLVLNLAILAYLLVSHRLFGLRGGAAAERALSDKDTGWPPLELATPAGLRVPPPPPPGEAGGLGSVAPTGVERG